MNKIMVITGVTGGIGSSAASFFIKNGWHVIGLSRNKDKLKALKKEINSDLFKYIQTDVSNYKSVKKAFDIISSLGKIDVLINNASIFKMKKFEDFDISEIDDIIDTNLKGTIYCTLESIKNMNFGRIINISSVSGIHGIENQSVYSASKYGVNGFSESLNQEVIKRGISISTICPGGINTPLWNKNNIYPGDTGKILQSLDIVNIMQYIINLPHNVIMKQIIMFPECEWH